MENRGYICIRPFSWLSLLDNGEVTCCCPPWINHYSFGNIMKQSFEEIWNGKKAQEFRKSCLDGTFRFCNINSCPHIQSKYVCVMLKTDIFKKIGEPLISDIKKNRLVLSHGPLDVIFTYDRSCNLSCPSCRRTHIIARGNRKKELLSIQEKFMNTFLSDATNLEISGSGDAFGSQLFRNFLFTLTRKQAPKCCYVNILTNGLLLKRYWPKLSPLVRECVSSVSVSIDACTKKTYEINRYPAKWEELLPNLEFLRLLKLYGKLESLRFSFVVQKNNYHEIIDFIKFAIFYSADYVQFQIIEPDFLKDLGFKDYFFEWKEKAVHEKKHPEHNKLLKILSDPILNNLKKKIFIDFGPLHNLRQGHDISQFDTVYGEFKLFVSGKKDWPSKVNYSEGILL